MMSHEPLRASVDLPVIGMGYWRYPGARPEALQRCRNFVIFAEAAGASSAVVHAGCNGACWVWSRSWLGLLLAGLAWRTDQRVGLPRCLRCVLRRSVCSSRHAGDAPGAVAARGWRQAPRGKPAPAHRSGLNLQRLDEPGDPSVPATLRASRQSVLNIYQRLIRPA